MSPSPDTTTTCSGCGTVLPATGPLHGLCEHCLLHDILTPSADGPPMHEERALARFGPYKLLEIIGRGGMGVVYRARQRVPDRIVALKMISHVVLDGEPAAQRFRTEVDATASLFHPNIIPVLDAGEIDGQLYYTMRLIEGRNPGAWSGRDHPPAETVRLAIRVAQAMHHAHSRGVLHRDLKPANILVDASGEPFVTDFGLARRLGINSSLTASGDLIGTPAFMAPEQARAGGGDDGSTVASDIYSLGAVLYTWLGGQPPFRAPTPLEVLQLLTKSEPAPLHVVRPEVDRNLSAICHHCLKKNPRHRYASAAELVADLERWMEGRPVMARLAGPLDRAWNWCRRHPAVSTAAALAFTSAAAGAVAVQQSHLYAQARSREAEAQEARRREHTAAYQSGILTARMALDRGYFQRAREVLTNLSPVSGAADHRGDDWRVLSGEVNLMEKGVKILHTISGLPAEPFCAALEGSGTLFGCGGRGFAGVWEYSAEGGMKNKWLHQSQAPDAGLCYFMSFNSESTLCVVALSRQVYVLDARTGEDLSHVENIAAQFRHQMDVPNVYMLSAMDANTGNDRLCPFFSSSFYSGNQPRNFLIGESNYAYSGDADPSAPPVSLTIMERSSIPQNILSARPLAWARMVVSNPISLVRTDILEASGYSAHNYVTHSSKLQTAWPAQPGVSDVAAGRDLLPVPPNEADFDVMAAAPHSVVMERGRGLTPLLLRGHTAPVTCFVHSIMWRRVISVAQDRTARIWDLSAQWDTGMRPLQRTSGSAGPMGDRVSRAVIISPDGRFLAQTRGAGMAQTWMTPTVRDPQTGEPVRLGPAVKFLDEYNEVDLKVEGCISPEFFAPDGTLAVTAQRERNTPVQMEWWNPETGQRTRAQLLDQCTDLDFTDTQDVPPAGCRNASADGAVFCATGGPERSVAAWRTADGKLLGRWKPAGVSCVTARTLSPDGRWLAFATQIPAAVIPGTNLVDKRASSYLVDLTHPAAPPVRLPPCGDHAGFLVFSPDSSRLVVSPAAGRGCTVLDVPALTEVTTLGRQNPPVCTAQFSADGKTLFTMHKDRYLRVINVASGQEIHSPLGNMDLKHSFVLDPAGRFIVWVNEEKNFSVFQFPPL